MIRYHLEKAIFLTTSGRPGPVWLDVPVDVQGSLIDVEHLKGFDKSELPQISTDNLQKDAKLVLEKYQRLKGQLLFVVQACVWQEL